ncbi:GNAT family N-acetyltransferase [Leptolyngbyaceae cyanobacterium CCMR0082]|uniref:GNAT family N-acetyltransferase n=2 Tax=Adonisia TaxID=2950183 RepID=A0A6M0S0E6_9CYAN|nr:GNAT family N-acetyltransferase [Adonisia turfae CCMR0082]
MVLSPIQSSLASKLLTMSRLNWDRVHTLPQDYWLRPAYPEDLSQLVELLLTSFYPQHRCNRWLYPLMRMGIQEDIKRRLKHSSNQYGCLVVIDKSAGAAIVGTVEISLRSQLWQPLQPRRPYIANVAVERQHRRRGLAQQMLLACEYIGKNWGCQQLYLHVATDNPPAIALYHKIGYQLHSQHPWQRKQMMVKELFH